MSEADLELVRRFSQAAMAFGEALERYAKRRVLGRIERRLEEELGRIFEEQGRLYTDFDTDYTERAQRDDGKVMFMDGAAAPLQAPLREAGVDWGGVIKRWMRADRRVEGLLVAAIQAAAGEALEAGARGLAAAVGALEAGAIAFSLKNPRARDYLKKHGAALVKQINEETRRQMRTILQYAADQGWSYNKAARAIQEQFKDYATGKNWWNMDAPRPQGHIDSRAHLIAVTESGQAYEAGSYQAAETLAELGVEVEKSWSTMNDELVSDGCRENQADGWIAYDELHTSGDLHPLRFPGCRCDEVYRRGA